MSRLLDAFDARVSPSDRIFGLYDTSVDTYGMDADSTKWLLSAPGLVYMQVPAQVIRATVRLESWSILPPEEDVQWFGREEVEVRLPGGDLAIHTIDGGRQEVPLILPSPGLYTMRWQWMFNSESGPFTSPLSWRTLEVPPVRDERLNDRDLYCLVQIWRTSAE
ncbi:hypothetical protein [Streptomyces sp. AC512_CC834]|uniref:hypothetical protein n=1 Tax=Streptomyces sp. AC512_CC834 TaxID=2823691 RepID=UPI001C2716B4|nr:hypothetical protein [Streptomyces sp. AC512_CC834]